MKLPFEIKIDRTGICVYYGRAPTVPDYFFYYWDFSWWHTYKETPWIGMEHLWYDGPHSSIWFKPFCISWSSPWTKDNTGWLKEEQE